MDFLKLKGHDQCNNNIVGLSNVEKDVKFHYVNERYVNKLQLSVINMLIISWLLIDSDDPFGWFLRNWMPFFIDLICIFPH